MKTVKKLFALFLCLGLAATFGSADSLAQEKDKKEVVLSKDNTIVLKDVVTGASVAKLISQARKLDAGLKSGYPIVLVLDTPGGSIQAGMELMEVFKALNRPVHTLTIFAASMGFQIVQHADERNILSYGTLMSHKAYGGFEGEFGGDGLSQMDSRYGFWLRRLKEMDEQTVKRTNGKQTLKSYRAAYENELWITGNEAVSLGYADNVVSARCDASLNGQTVEKFFFFGIPITIKFSECPLNTYPEEIEVGVDSNKGRMSLDDFLSKGGEFGPNCVANPSRTLWVYGPSQEKDDTKLCATNKELTLEKLINVKESVRSEYDTSSRKKKIKVSW